MVRACQLQPPVAPGACRPSGFGVGPPKLSFWPPSMWPFVLVPGRSFLGVPPGALGGCFPALSDLLPHERVATDRNPLEGVPFRGVSYRIVRLLPFVP